MVMVRSVLGELKVGQAYSRQAKWLTANSTLREAVELTLSSFQSDFPVCEDSRVVGLLTHTQLVEALSRGGPEQTVRSSMRANITPLSPGDSLVHAQNRLNEERVDALPVEEAGQFVGLVTSRDIGEVFQLASRWPGFSERATRAIPS